MDQLPHSCYSAIARDEKRKAKMRPTTGEYTAITDEHPRYNKTHNPNPQASEIAYTTPDSDEHVNLLLAAGLIS